MTPEMVRRINRDRLAGWAERLCGEHATPLLLVGCGHDHRQGQVTLCVCEDGPSGRELAEVLRGVASLLEGE